MKKVQANLTNIFRNKPVFMHDTKIGTIAHQVSVRAKKPSYDGTPSVSILSTWTKKVLPEMMIEEVLWNWLYVNFVRWPY